MTTTQAPQHMQALQRGNAIRLFRAEIKRQVRAGEVKAADLIRDPTPGLEGMEVRAVLGAQFRWGRGRVNAFLERHRASRDTTLGELDERAVASMTFELDPPPPPAVEEREPELVFLSCSECERELPETSFARDRYQKRRRKHACRECESVRKADEYRRKMEIKRERELLAQGIPARGCRCDEPMVFTEEDGERRCLRCGRAVS